MENRIDAVLSDADKTDILNHIKQIKEKLPFLIDLSPEERQALPKMGNKRRSFVADALSLAEQDDSFLPRSFDVAEMRKDVEITESLAPIVVAMTQLAELLDDTYTLAGSEAYSGGLIVYQSATRNGKGAALDRLADTLGKSFARKSKGKTGEPPDEEDK
ncbi:MAG: hypothetical protein WA584_08100 [Pyrinomonadaceae bacterium]